MFIWSLKEYSNVVYVFVQYGLVGHFWHSASGSTHLLLFAIVAAEIRIKAPGAKTFLQVTKLV